MLKLDPFDPVFRAALAAWIGGALLWLSALALRRAWRWIGYRVGDWLYERRARARCEEDFRENRLAGRIAREVEAGLIRETRKGEDKGFELVIRVGSRVVTAQEFSCVAEGWNMQTPLDPLTLRDAEKYPLVLEVRRRRG